jgi:hypothetical protein
MQIFLCDPQHPAKRKSIPYRIDIAGTWIDQPYVSKYNPGWAITASIEPTIEFNERSGMATSTRKKAIELWSTQFRWKALRSLQEYCSGMIMTRVPKMSAEVRILLG